MNLSIGKHMLKINFVVPTLPENKQGRPNCWNGPVCLYLFNEKLHITSETPLSLDGTSATVAMPMAGTDNMPLR